MERDVGDDAEFDDFVAARWPRLVRAAVLLGCSSHEAEDVVQTALTRCLVKWSRVRRADDRDAYVYRVLVNTLTDSRRRLWRGEQPTEHLPERAAGADPTRDVLVRDSVDRALARLSADQRAAVVLRYYAHLTEAQMASVLDVAPGTVKSRLSRALAALALDPDLADVTVGPPPLAALHRTVRRRRSYAAGLAAAAAVAVVAGGAALWPAGDVGDTREPAPAASDVPTAAPEPEPEPADDTPPPGTRWVGIGQAVIAVPDSWGTNATGCGTPTRDTVVVDQGVVPLCLLPYPSDTTSVDIRGRNAVDEIQGWTPIEVDGEAALRSPVGSARSFGGGLHAASVYFPERDVMFAAQSSVSARAVTEVLEGITILDTLVAVPGFSPANEGEQRKAGENYVQTLTEAGLRAKVVVKPSRSTPGFVWGAFPRPGTVVEPGSTVTVTVLG